MNSVIEAVFRETIEFTLACFLRSTVYDYKDKWLNHLQGKFSEKIEEITNTISKVKYELTANMLKTSTEAKENWDRLKTNGIIRETFEGIQLTKVQFTKNGRIKLRCAFKLLQYFLHFYPEINCNQHVDIEIPIGGANAVFQLSRAEYGTNQILVNIENNHYPDATSRKGPGKYEDFVDSELD